MAASDPIHRLSATEPVAILAFPMTQPSIHTPSITRPHPLATPQQSRRQSPSAGCAGPATPTWVELLGER
jgi:hypothetical protein